MEQRLYHAARAALAISRLTAGVVISGGNRRPQRGRAQRFDFAGASPAFRSIFVNVTAPFKLD